MPDHRGQTYDRQHEPAPRGGWFRMEERPYPERLDKAFRVAAAVVAIAAVGGFVAYMESLSADALAPKAIAAAIAVGLIPAALAYGFTRAIGMVVVGLYGTVRDGSEFVVDWRAVHHDLPLRRTWIVILEGVLLLAAGGTAFWGAMRFMKQGDEFGLLACIVILIMTYWPLIRRRIAAERTRA